MSVLQIFLLLSHLQHIIIHLGKRIIFPLLYMPNKKQMQPHSTPPRPPRPPLSSCSHFDHCRGTELSFIHLSTVQLERSQIPATIMSHLLRTLNYPPLSSRCETTLLISFSLCSSLDLHSSFITAPTPPPPITIYCKYIELFIGPLRCSALYYL